MADRNTVSDLLSWYDGNARALPWRGISDAYRTWVSEIMLQQTRVETVIPYYQRFLEAFPTLEALASAPEEHVLKLWEGLGYYSRARNLHRGANQVMEQYGGILPRDAALLKKISGIGAYTAGAIASIAYGLPVPAVDGNVIRVISRLTGLREDVGAPSVRRELERRVAAMIPSDRPGDFNQALMDLGARVCVPGTPDCGACPLHGLCDAESAGDAEDLPVLPRKTPPKEIDLDLCLVYHPEGVLMRCRTETLLKGMWVFPLLKGHGAPETLPARIEKETGVHASDPVFLARARHVFTHRIWNMKIWQLRTSETARSREWCFLSPEQMDQVPIPTAVKTARELADEKFRGLAAGNAGQQNRPDAASRGRLKGTDNPDGH